jgi:CRISPR/Cas system-associated endonuclease Cas1
MATAVTLFSKQVLKQDDFSVNDKKCALTKHGFTKLMRQMEKKYQHQVIRNDGDKALSYREQIFHDARQIADWVDCKQQSLSFFKIK